VMDEGSEKVRQLSITLADDKPWLRPVWKQARRAGSFAPSPSGKRIVVEFRGDIFSVPESKGEARNLTRSPGRRERDPDWSPDGKTITYLAEDGENYELFARDAATGAERQLTRGSPAWILGYQWSPDSSTIGFTDKNNRLVALDVATSKQTVLDVGSEAGFREWSFSADNRWVTYTKQSRNSFRSIWLCEVKDPEPFRVTSDQYQDRSPSFDPKGRYLYFVSSRDYKHEGYEFESRMYALLLRKDVEHPFGPQSDEEPLTDASKEDPATDPANDPAATDSVAKKSVAKNSGEKKSEKPKPWIIDRDRLADRLVVLPESTGAYFGLVGVDDGLLFFSAAGLSKFDLKTRKSSEVVKGLRRGYALTPDRKRMFYSYKGDLCYGKPAAGHKAGANKVSLAGVRVRVVPQEEWQQMYTDAWRIMRDYFYDPNMHGVDWRAMRDKYQPLVRHASHRTDLDFLIGELIGELNCGHTYVTQGETPRVDRVPIGLLGCEFEQIDERYRIKAIFAGENWVERTRSPLTEPGVKVDEGDYLIAINGEDVVAPKTPYQFLENTVGRQVTLLVNDKPSREGARKVVVKPIASEVGLRKLAWVRHNRAIVDKLSGGRIGYIHVPNTAIDGHRELFKGFRPQALVKEAMIIDDRYNGGGWVPSDMAMSLRQPVLSYWARRNSQMSTTPTFAFEGPMTMLINGYSSSGGDAFPFYFRKLGHGKLIGKKTWGGLVGYSGSPRLLDGGGLAVPGFAFVNTNGEWDVEAVGVAPDIEVFDDPTRIQAGSEPTLEAAVKHLLAELGKKPVRSRPAPPDGPKRNK
jgi:tricorn protease